MYDFKLYQIFVTLQETNVLTVHLIGAFLAFAVGFVYMVLQTIISHKSKTFNIVGNTLFITKLRILLCVADVILLLVCILFKMKISQIPSDTSEETHLVNIHMEHIN